MRNAVSRQSASKGIKLNGRHFAFFYLNLEPLAVFDSFFFVFLPSSGIRFVFVSRKLQLLVFPRLSSLCLSHLSCLGDNLRRQDHNQTACQHSVLLVRSLQLTTVRFPRHQRLPRRILMPCSTQITLWTAKVFFTILPSFLRTPFHLKLLVMGYNANYPSPLLPYVTFMVYYISRVKSCCLYPRKVCNKDMISCILQGLKSVKE